MGTPLTTTREDDALGWSDLPGWLQALIVATIVVYGSWLWMPTWQFYLLWGGTIAFVLALLYLFVQRHEDPIQALSAVARALVNPGERSDSVETVPRLSSYQKSKLKNAVGMECEVPGCTTKRSLHTHHITPRSEGGANGLSNLIVVCRNHHADCDNGSFNRTQQREMIRGDRFADDGIKEYWRRSIS